MKSIAHRLAGLEVKMRKVLLPLVIFYRGETGLSIEQKQRIDSAKAEGRPVRLIRTTVIAGMDEGCNG